MGLLGRVDSGGVSGVARAPVDARALVDEFCQENPMFHCVVLKHDGKRKGLSRQISELTARHGAACGDLSDKNCLVLLPGGFDMELFSHRVSNSTDSTVVLQFTADSSATALDTLRSYLP